MKKRIVLLVALFTVAAVAASAQQMPRIVNGGVVNGKAVSLPRPDYPAAARAVRAQGAVQVEVVIDESGFVASAIAKSGHPLLRQASVNAAKGARFEATTIDGEAVQVKGVIVYNFQLPPADEEPVDEPPADDPVETDDVEYIGIGASLRIMSNLNADPRMDEISKLFFDEFGKEFGDEELPEDFIGIRDLPTASRERRSEILAKLYTAFRQDLTEDQIWQFALGDVYGELSAESLRRIALGESNTEFYRVRILKIRDLMASAPKETPVRLRNSFNELVFIGSKANLEIEDLDEIDQKLEALEDLVFM